MTWADQHTITDSAQPSKEMVITMPSGGIDMLIFEHKVMSPGGSAPPGRGRMERTQLPIALDREAAKRLFAILGMYLHSWEDPAGD